MADRLADRPTVEIPMMRRPGAPRRGGMDRFAPREKAKDSRGTFRRLLRFYLQEGRLLFNVLLFILVDVAVMIIAAPLLIGRAVTAMTGTVQFSLIDIYIPLLIGLYCLDWLLSTLQGVIMNTVTQKIVRTLRKTLFDKLQRLPLQYHDTHTHGELMSRLTNDVDNISVTIAQTTTQLLNAVTTILVAFAIMMLLSVYLTLAALVTIPFIFILTKIIAKRSRKLFLSQQTELGKLNGIIEEAIGGQKMVKAFNMEGKITGNFDAVNKRLRYSAVRAQAWSGALMPLMNVMTNLGYASVVIVGGLLIVKGMITIGVVSSFTIWSRQFAMPLNNIAGMFNNLQSALAGAERIFEVLATDDETPDEPDAVELSAPQGEVQFKEVCFSYVPGVEVLKDISFSVKAGQTIALVGPTGAGKTTIVNLLTRFYDATSGAVLIDGMDIKHYKRDSLRSAFSVVLQDTCLFTGTIADNIRYGRPESTDGEVEEAARMAGADSFIRRLRHGYQTMVSGESDSLSQGQRQLLAIARAILCRAPILVLDEATSSVDTRTELKIQAAVLGLTRGCTSFIIAHRLSTIRDADVIMVVAGGRIVESGSHEELLAAGGGYAAMYNSQFE